MNTTYIIEFMATLLINARNWKKNKRATGSHKERKEAWRAGELWSDITREGDRPIDKNPPLANKLTHQAIHVISGGETLTSDSSTSRKTYARLAYQISSVIETRENEEPITFTPANRGDIIILHDDSMVILAIIAKHPIGRILVDNGSLVNLLYWNCFE